MKRICVIICLITVMSISLFACNTPEYETVELTKDNFYDYFERFEGGYIGPGESVDSFRFVEMNSEDPAISALFYPKEIEDKYFTDVKIELTINTYYGIESIDEMSEPTSTDVIEIPLTWHKGDDYVVYTVGATLVSGWVYYREKNGEEQKTYTILRLLENWASHDYSYTDYCREIIVSAVSGKVSIGGLTYLNNYHCN